MSTGQLSEESLAYLQEKQIEPLMGHLMHDLLLALPDDPLSYLEELLQNNPVPKLIVVGPPGCGKSTQCTRIAQYTGAVHISTGDLLREETRNATELGKAAQQYIDKGQLVSDSLLTELLTARMNQEDVKNNGWILDGFPRTRPQALSLQLKGIIPTAFLILDSSFKVCRERVEPIRICMESGQMYHLHDNPPPADVDVVVRPEDSLEAFICRTDNYNRCIQEVSVCYPSAIVRVDADQDQGDVFEAMKKKIDAMKVSIN